MLVNFMYSIDFFDYVHGAICPVVLMCSSRPLRRLRDGDVTEWYQSFELQQWASMGQEGAVTEGRITFSVQQNSREQRIQKNRLSVERSDHLRKWNSAVAEGLEKWTSAVVEGWVKSLVRHCGRVLKVELSPFRAAKRSCSRS